MKSCYEQIFHSATSLAFQRLGIILLEIIIMLDTIQRISQTVRMSHGDSNIMYGGDTILDDFRNFTMGLFQVNGSAPQIWSIIYSGVFSALWSQGFVIQFENYFTTEIAQLVAFSYVNNCNMFQSDNDVETTHLKMQL